MIRKELILHILPAKAMLYETIEDRHKETTALIVCSNNPVSSDITARTGSFCTAMFADVTSSDHPYAMKAEHAGLIRNYILGLKDEVEDLYICCDSGESRSPAIASAILLASGLSDLCVWENPFYTPNTLVYERMCIVFGIQISKDEIQRKKQINERAYRLTQERHGVSPFSRWQIIDMNDL